MACAWLHGITSDPCPAMHAYLAAGGLGKGVKKLVKALPERVLSAWVVAIEVGGHIIFGDQRGHTACIFLAFQLASDPCPAMHAQLAECLRKGGQKSHSSMEQLLADHIILYDLT